jgi:hypothetical protein
MQEQEQAMPSDSPKKRHYHSGEQGSPTKPKSEEVSGLIFALQRPPPAAPVEAPTLKQDDSDRLKELLISSNVPQTYIASTQADTVR